MIKFFGFLLFFCNIGIILAADREFGHPIFRTFTAHDYDEVGQIFAITEDPQGRMLFGCEDAILVFDNNRWETVPTPGTGFIRSFAADNKGVVWFSSSTEIGYLSRIGGKYAAVKVYDGPLGVNSRIIVNGDRLYFTSDAGLLGWNNGHLSQQPWPTASITPFSAAVCHGKIWVGDRNGPLYEFAGGKFNKIAESPPSKTGEVRAIVDCPIGDGLIVRPSGIFRKIGAALVPWPTDIDSLLKSPAIYFAKWILGKYLAVLVQNSGIYLLDQDGHLIESFTVNSGLSDTGFASLGEDRDGGLWVGTDTEITRIQFAVGYTEFDHELGLPKGWVTGVIRYQGKIYAATQHGVYVLDAVEDGTPSSHFLRFGDRSDRCYGMTVSGSTASVISEVATYSLNVASSRLEPIGSPGAVVTASRTDPKRLFLSTRKGLESVRNVDGQWCSEGVLSQLPYYIGGLAEDEKGDLLLSTESNGLYRIQLKPGAHPLFRDARIEQLTDIHGRKVPSGQGSVCQWQGETLFVGAGRVWKLAPGEKRLEPFALTEKVLPGRNVQMITRSQLTDDYVWVSSRPPNAGPETGVEVGRLYSTGRYEALSHGASYPLGLINSVWDENAEGEPVAWIAGDYGLMRVLLDRPAFSTRKFDLYPSQIVTANGKPIPIPNGKELTLRYDDRDFQILFGTDHFSVGNELYYQATLNGEPGHGSPTLTAPVWRSGALNEGHYLLLVEAKDSNGVESKELRLAFTIKPPWYRTLWMEIAWGLLAILIVYLAIRWRTWQMTVAQRRLVQIVDLRTRELRLNEIELRKAKDAAELEGGRAETANRAKTAFLANMSHELRTPLNSILGYAQILLRRRDTGDDGGARLRTILASGEHLLEMINEVLDLSRVESGKASVQLRPLELPKFIAGIVDEFQLRAALGQLRFVHEIHGELPRWIETDPLRLRQVLYNLLGNAVKFTSQGEIALRVYATSEQLRFEVKDTGKGIPQKDLPSIFKPFYQASNNQLIGQGVGLGLYISKQIVELLGGKISIDSEPTRGSTFNFEIPRRDTNPGYPELASPQIIGYEGPVRKILVLDDEPLNRSMLRELLSTVGFDTVPAESTEQAISLLKDRFDAVISDIRMPGDDGNIFCRRLRSSDETKNLIIIASSGSVFADDRRLALASGFNDFLAKPIMEQELFEILGKHLGIEWEYAERNKSSEHDNFPLPAASTRPFAHSPIRDLAP
jgi:signal transduction histidine kinase/CheY-like chemotaxis protein